jgi:hypothetical protein
MTFGEIIYREREFLTEGKLGEPIYLYAAGVEGQLSLMLRDSGCNMYSN